MAKPSYSSTTLTCIESKFGQDIISPTKQLDSGLNIIKI